MTVAVLLSCGMTVVGLLSCGMTVVGLLLRGLTREWLLSGRMTMERLRFAPCGLMRERLLRGQWLLVPHSRETRRGN